MEALLPIIPVVGLLAWRVLRMRLLDDGASLISRGFFRSGSIPWSEVIEIVPRGRGGYAAAVGNSRQLHLACVPPTISNRWTEFRDSLLERAQTRGRDDDDAKPGE